MTNTHDIVLERLRALRRSVQTRAAFGATVSVGFVIHEVSSIIELSDDPEEEQEPNIMAIESCRQVVPENSFEIVA
jgi:hypothetical protein